MPEYLMLCTAEPDTVRYYDIEQTAKRLHKAVAYNA